MTTKTLRQILIDAIEERMIEVNTSMPGRVVKVDVPNATCDVQPLFQRKYADGELVNLPIITRVPIANYRAGNSFISLPVKVGHFVKIDFSQRSLDKWLNGDGSIVDPQDPRKFHLSDAIAYPGVYPFSSPPEGATADDLVIKNEQSKVTVKPNGEILLEGSAIKALADLVVLSGEGDAIALASKVLQELQNIKTAYDTHSHIYSPGPGGPTPTAPPAVPLTPPQSVASTKVKAE